MEGNNAATKADKEAAVSVTTRRKIRVARCVCRISRGWREKTAKRGQQTPGIDYGARDRTLCHPPPTSGGWPTAAAATQAAPREKSCAVVVPESLRLPLFRLRSIPTVLVGSWPIPFYN